jgi:peptidyl-prolyl cis-trans isomerase C
MRHARGWGFILWLAATGAWLSGGAACKKSGGAKAAPEGTGATSELPPQTADELAAPVATIDGTVISVAEFQERINKQSPYVRARYTSLEQKKEFLDNLIRFEVLAREAKRRGFDQDPEVVRTMKKMMIQKLMTSEFAAAIKPEDISDEELRAYYEEHKDEYNVAEQVRVSAIVLGNAKTAREVAKAAHAAAGPANNKAFQDLVREHSTDKVSRARGGDLRFFDRTTKEVPAPVVEAAFGLAQTGDVAGPIDTGDGTFYIIKQTGKRPAVTKTFDDLKRKLQNRLYRDKRTTAQKDFIAGLRAKATITIDEAALERVRVDTSAAPQRDAHGHGGEGPPPFPTGEASQPIPPPVLNPNDDDPLANDPANP